MFEYREIRNNLLKEIEEESKRLSEAKVKLLAALIYCEAGNQPYKGKVAVGSVVLNRMNSKRFPNTLEGVIYQRGQYSPTWHGFMNRKPTFPPLCAKSGVITIKGGKNLFPPKTP